jgi:hypothetical protein
MVLVFAKTAGEEKPVKSLFALMNVHSKELVLLKGADVTKVSEEKIARFVTS